MSKRRGRVRREPVEITIEGLSHEGRGVGRIDGKTVFVFGALPGERVSARITRRRGRFDEAETVAVLDAAPQRMAPACAHFGVCGGCALQHMGEAQQLEHKQGVLLELLQHHAGCRPDKLAEPIRGPQWGYRRKARLGVKVVAAKGGVIVGFRERGKPYVTDCARCEILDPRVGAQLPALRAVVQSLSCAARIPQIEIAMADAVAALVFRHLDPLSEDDHERLREFGHNHGFEIFLQSGGPETVVPLSGGAAPLHYRVDGLDLSFAAIDFTQVNATINAAMVDQALAWLDPGDSDRVADLFCGIGNFTLPIAQRAASVAGFEAAEALVRRAADNARANHLKNCTFTSVDLADGAALAELDLGNINKLLLDPPRAGAIEVIEALDFSAITRLVYVSCNPVTLARDTAMLCQRHGYRLVNSGIADMFPQTAHFESMSLFEKSR